MSRTLLICLCLGLGLVAACTGTPAGVEPPARQGAVQEEEAAPREPGDVYVILPSNYNRYVDGKLLFASAGLTENLPVYATAREAEHALRSFESVSERARHVWAVYRLAADWSGDVITLESGGHRLKTPAKVLNMETEENAQ